MLTLEIDGLEPVAGTAAPKTFGWARNAQIYAVKVNGLEGTEIAALVLQLTMYLMLLNYGIEINP